MEYIVDDKKLDAFTFIAFVKQVWQGNYDITALRTLSRRRSLTLILKNVRSFPFMTRAFRRSTATS